MADRSRIPFALHLVVLGGWVAWVIAHLLPQPLVVDEVAFAHWAVRPFIPLPHPPLYMCLLALLHHGLKLPPELLRVVGIVTTGLTAWLMYRLAERMERGAGLWTLWLLLTNPLLLHGTLLLDIDNTVLMWWLACAVWWAARAAWPLDVRTLRRLGFWLGFGLLMKVTTPLVWPAALWLVYAARGEGRRGLKAVVFMSLVGLATFLAIWTLYSGLTGIPWMRLVTGRVIDMFLRGPTDLGTSVLQELGERSLRIGLWIGPLALCLWVLGTMRCVQSRQQLRGREAWLLVLIVGWMLLLGYWVVGGVVWSFAKYHCPFIPLLAVIGGATAARGCRDSRLPRWVIIGLTLAITLLSAVVVGDVLYLVSHTLRYASVYAPRSVPQALLHVAGRLGWLVAGALGMGLVLWGCRGSWRLQDSGVLPLVLALGAVGSGAGVMITQARAPYSTTYCYGRPWATDQAVLRSLREFMAAHPSARVLVPDRTYMLITGMDCETQPNCTFWTGHETPEELVASLQHQDYVMIDPDNNPARFLREVLPDPRVQAVLQRAFEAQPAGTATVWVRRSFTPYHGSPARSLGDGLGIPRRGIPSDGEGQGGEEQRTTPKGSSPKPRPSDRGTGFTQATRRKSPLPP